MPYATMADAHREWHTNSGVPMGTPGCPQDACHLPDEGPYDSEAEAAYYGPQTHEVVTCYGTVPAFGLDHAKAVAKTAAIATGKRTVIKKVEA